VEDESLNISEINEGNIFKIYLLSPPHFFVVVIFNSCFILW